MFKWVPFPQSSINDQIVSWSKSTRKVSLKVIWDKIPYFPIFH